MLQELREKIIATDQVLSESRMANYSGPIDLNRDDWFEIARKQSAAFREEHSEVVSDLTREILDGVNTLNDHDKRIIINDIRSTENLRNLLNLTGDQDTVENKIILFIITSSGVDKRDALLELNDLIELAKEKGVNYKSIIEEFLPFLDVTNSSEIRSMKEILEQMI